MSSGRANRKTSDSAGQPLYHIKDLEQLATQDLTPNITITNLISEAENSLQYALSLLEHGKPDLAYRHYLRTYEILVGCVPANPLYPDFQSKRGTSFARFINIGKTLQKWTGQFDKVKEQIISDNARYGTEPRMKPASSASARTRPSSTSALPQQPNGHKKSGTVDGRSPKPPVSPKPESLRFADPRQNVTAPTSPIKHSPDSLTQRFERLKMYPSSIDTGERSSRASLQGPTLSPITSPVLRPGSQHSLDGIKPAGPRALNGHTVSAPREVFLSSALPQAPSPAYHPYKSATPSNTLDIPPPDSRNGGSTADLGGSAVSAASLSIIDSGYLSSTTPYTASTTHARSPSISAEATIGAERLYDYLRMFNILIIDVRDRAQFDAGHIFAQSVICVEPAALRKDMSATELQESLVLSPDSEQQMFYNRAKYDLVLFYDQSTTSDRFLTRPQTESEYALYYLYEALWTFNDESNLKKPPILLSGGIDAWIYLVGKQALVTSNTLSKIKRSSRVSKRAPVPTGDSRIQVTKRRLRDYNPLDAEEEQRWHERARQESVVIPHSADADEESEAYQVNDASPFPDSIEDFNRRFPEAAELGQDLPVVDEQRSAPAPPPKIPLYPETPQRAEPSVPSILKRPAPAAPRMSYSGVNERSVSQTKSVDLPAYIPPHLQPSNLRLPRTGLVNFGVTCYMNATIQALSATLPLSLFFLDDKYERLVQCDNWRGSKGVLPNLYANLVRNIWKGDVQAIRPTTLRAFCARLNSEWGINRQQDAKEFFDFLVDCLHEDLNVNYSRTPLRALTIDQEMQRERTPMPIVCKEEWGRYLHREQSYLTSLFGGQHASRLRCTTCHFTSTTYEAFYSISVEIPRSGKSTIQDCLKSYCAEEMLSGDEVWKCPRCDKEREATKKLTLTRMPQFLVVHFKRFSASKTESAKKVRTPIDFPLQGLDLEPYVLPPPTASEAQDIARRYGAQHLKTDLASTPPYQYDAYAVMRHIGTTLTSGHYTCLTRDRARKCWRQYDDTQTRDLDPTQLSSKDKLQNEQAYIVFFQRTTMA